jgi:hypothetical protein
LNLVRVSSLSKGLYLLEFYKKNMLRDLKRIAAGVSLIMLALGFLSLGILSFMNRLQGELAVGSALEKNCCIAGSAVSVLAGAIFLVAARIYWSRLPAEPSAAGEEQRKRIR